MPTTTHFRTCHLCEAMCGVAIEVEEDVVTTIRGDREDTFSRGHICPKAMGLKDVHEDPDRLILPQRRVGDRWETVAWDAALDEVAERLAGVQRSQGRDAVALYQGNPTVHNYGSMMFGQLLSTSLGSRSRFSATSVDQLPHMLASLLMFGHQLLLPVPDLDRTAHLLVLGANPVASNGSLMTAPDVAKRLREIGARGGKVVVVDPRRTETADLAAEHVSIRPGTDALLLMGILHTLFAENLTRPGRLAAITDGSPEIARAARDFPPERIAEATGVPADEVRRLARELAAAESGAVYGRVGVATQEFGALSCWLINVINIVTGNLDRAGGVMFTRPAVDVVGLMAKGGQRGHFDRGRTRVRGLPEFGGEYPVAALAEEIDTPGPGQIRGLVTSAGNPVLSTPNGKRLERALASLDYMVSIDFYRNETTRHAHMILPPTFALEHDHYDLAFHALAIRNTAKYSLPLFQPALGARHDWQIMLGLADRLEARRSGGASLGWQLTSKALSRLGPAGLLDLALRAGPHGKRLPLGEGLTLDALKKAPHGVDLGALTEALPAGLHTRSKRIDLTPAPLMADLPRLLASLSRKHEGLSLIGRRDLRSNNSWMHNSQRLVKGRDRCTLMMHPDDARARGLANEQQVSIASRVGTVVAKLEITDALMPGVVSLPHGWGHHREGTQLSVASAHAGVSANDLTDELLLDDLSGNARLSGVPVEVSAEH